MSEHEIIKQEGDLRVTLSRDEYPDEPYDDGQCPIVRIERGSYSRGGAEHVMVGGMRPTDRDDRIEEALDHFMNIGHLDWFERYLRAYHGATVIKQYGPNQSTDYTYFAYDTPEWAEAIGFDDKIAPRADYDASKAVQMDEWIAYLEGDVFSYDVERRVNVHMTKKVTREDGSDVGTIERDYAEWEHVDSCGGFYGYKYARECALEALEHQKG